MPREAFERPEVDERIGIPGYAKEYTLAAGAAVGSSVRLVTYNIHTCVGVDRRYDPGRIAAVLREIDADIACL